MSLNNLKAEVIAERAGKSDRQRIEDGLKAMPENQMLLCAQELHHVLIPKIKKVRGDSHPDTKFFEDVRDSIIYSLHILSKYNDLNREYYNKKILCEYLFNRTRLLETELHKYQAIEDLEFTSALEDYRDVIKAKALDMLNNLPHGNNNLI